MFFIRYLQKNTVQSGTMNGANCEPMTLIVVLDKNEDLIFNNAFNDLPF
jgi:hypothetical protein